MEYVVIIETAEDGSFSAYVPDLPGCTSCGDTIEELRINIAKAIKLHIESLRENHERVPPPTSMTEKVRAA